MKNNIKQYVKKKLRRRPVIVEVGSHYGEDSIDFVRVLDPSIVCCFEPDPRNIYMFKKHITDKRIRLYEYAVSDKDENSIDFYLSYSSNIGSTMFEKYHWIDKKEYIDMKINASGASSLKRGHPLLDEGEVVSVSTIRMDTWAKKNNIEQIDFLWIDVQGAERGVVSGLGDFSDRIKSIWIEFGEDGYEGYMTRKETISLLSSLGFRVDKKMSDSGKKGNLLFWKKENA